MALIDPELILLIDRFFDLTYLNTIPMVNLLATAVISIEIFKKKQLFVLIVIGDN